MSIPCFESSCIVTKLGICSLQYLYPAFMASALTLYLASSISFMPWHESWRAAAEVGFMSSFIASVLKQMSLLKILCHPFLHHKILSIKF